MEVKEIDSVDINNINEFEISAYVLSNGDVVDKQFIHKSNDNDNSNVIEEEDEFTELYNSGVVYKPPVVLSNLKQYSTENPYHLRCINQKIIDAVNGWKLIFIDENGNEIKQPPQRSTNFNKLDKFFNNCIYENEEDDLLDLLFKVGVDYLTYAIGAVEVIRNKRGTPVKLRHIPSHTLRIVKDISKFKNLNSNYKYVIQRVNTQERIFKIFSSDGVKRLREPNTNKPMTEVVLIRNYHVDGGKYGLPEWLPALKALLGFDKVAHYNINFFENEAVPRFAVIVQGGKLDETSKNEIRSYFKSDLKGIKNSNKTLVLTTGHNAEVKLIPLAMDEKDSSFRFYRKDNRDEIIAAHGVPPHRIQIYDSGNSGTYSPSSIFTLDKIYKYSVIVPLQRKLETIFNRIIANGFKINNIRFKLNDLDIGEHEQRATIMKNVATAHERYINAGVMTIDEVRTELEIKQYKDILTDQEIIEWANTPRPIYLIRKAQQNEGLDANLGEENLNQTSNEFDEKSQDLTQQRLNDNDIKNLSMDSGSDLES